MTKKLYFLSLLAFVWSTWALSMEFEDVGIGQEYIQPLRYPKFSMAADYDMLRRFHGFGGPGLQEKLASTWGGTLAFEAGLYKYLNAGASFSFNMPGDFRQETQPMPMRFMLFAKPYIPIGDRFSFFARVGGGLTWSFYSMYHYYMGPNAKASAKAFRDIYKQQEYTMVPFGATAMATAGIEVFPFSRVGIALECGFRVDYYYARQSSFIGDLVRDSGKKGKDTVGAPSSLNYLLYEMPISLTFHFIL